MFREVESLCEVTIPQKQLGSVSFGSITNGILKDLKSREQLGYFLTVTNLKSIDKWKVLESNDHVGHVSVQVAFTCRTFLPKKGEILQGVVQRVHSFGVMLRCGPVKYIFLSERKMPNYHYVNGDNPAFLNDELSRIEKDVLVRFSVIDVRWMEESHAYDARREFRVLASLEGDSLGPVSLCGDEFNCEFLHNTEHWHTCSFTV